MSTTYYESTGTPTMLGAVATIRRSHNGVWRVYVYRGGEMETTRFGEGEDAEREARAFYDRAAAVINAQKALGL